MQCDNSGWNEEREVDWNVLVLVNLSFVLMCHIPKKNLDKVFSALSFCSK